MTTDNKNLTDKIRLILLIRCYIWPDFNYQIISLHSGKAVVIKWATNKRIRSSPFVYSFFIR